MAKEFSDDDLDLASSSSHDEEEGDGSLGQSNENINAKFNTRSSRKRIAEIVNNSSHPVSSSGRDFLKTDKIPTRFFTKKNSIVTPEGFSPKGEEVKKPYTSSKTFDLLILLNLNPIANIYITDNLALTQEKPTRFTLNKRKAIIGRKNTYISPENKHRTYMARELKDSMIKVNNLVENTQRQLTNTDLLDEDHKSA